MTWLLRIIQFLRDVWAAWLRDVKEPEREDVTAAQQEIVNETNQNVASVHAMSDNQIADAAVDLGLVSNDSDNGRCPLGQAVNKSQ